MTRTLLKVFMGAAIGTLSMVNAMAQSPAKLVMDVPFNFQIHGKTLPAGEYTLTRGMNGVMVVNCLSQRGTSQLVLTATSRDARQVNPHATFQRYGDRIYLTQVYLNSDQPTWEILPGKVEREAQKTTVAVRSEIPIHAYTAMNR